VTRAKRSEIVSSLLAAIGRCASADSPDASTTGR
jgi:hypothetical protein